MLARKTNGATLFILSSIGVRFLKHHSSIRRENILANPSQFRVFIQLYVLFSARKLLASLNDLKDCLSQNFTGPLYKHSQTILSSF